MIPYVTDWQNNSVYTVASWLLTSWGDILPILMHERSSDASALLFCAEYLFPVPWQVALVIAVQSTDFHRPINSKN